MAKRDSKMRQRNSEMEQQNKGGYQEAGKAGFNNLEIPTFNSNMQFQVFNSKFSIDGYFAIK